VEVVDLRIMIAGTMPKPMFPKLDAAVQLGPAAPYGQRSVLAEGSARVVPVWRRGDLRAGHTLTGPGLVDQDDTTVFVAAVGSGRCARAVTSCCKGRVMAIDNVMLGVLNAYFRARRRPPDLR
jgi:N-methylhydantoinase A/oxoprolinase/acetone carboxylase beta subunit